MLLTEHNTFESVASEQIDAAAGVIHDVRILGAESRRGRYYSETARDDAVRLYDRVGVFLNHNPESDPGRNREVLTESFGELRNIRHDKATSAVFADHHFPTKHPFAPVYIEHATRFPRQLGFSHNADGEYGDDKKDGQPVVESLSFVQSVDLVDRAATNRGLFESEKKPMKILTTIRRLCSANRRHPVATALLEAEGVALDAPVEVEEPAAEEAAAETGESGLKDALRAAIMQVFDDESIDAEATRKKIIALLKAGEKMEKEVNGEPAEAAAEPEAEATEETPAEMESLRRHVAALTESINARNRRDAVRDEINSEDRIATPEQFDALCKLDASARGTMIESLPTSADTRRPSRSRSRFNESIGELPKTVDGESFAKAMR